MFVWFSTKLQFKFLPFISDDVRRYYDTTNITSGEDQNSTSSFPCGRTHQANTVSVMETNLATQHVPKADPTDKVMVLGVLTIFLLLAALTSALPSLDPLDQTGQPEQDALVSGDTAWVLTSSALVLLMTPGVSFFYGGMVDHKNIISTMYQRCVYTVEVSLSYIHVKTLL